MKEYSLSIEERRKLAPHHRLFQVAVATVANITLGVEIERAEGIPRFHGGVVVNGLHIAIGNRHVQEVRRGKDTTTVEEIALAAAIEIFATRFKKDGPKVFKPYRKYDQTLLRDPLHAALLDYLPK